MNTIQLLKAKSLGVKEFRDSASEYVGDESPVVITVSGKPKKVLVPYDSMVEILEMIEEIRNGQLTEEVKNGRAAYKESGKGVSARRLWGKYK